MIPFLHYVRAHEALAHTGCDVDECVHRAPGHVCIPEQGPVSEPEAHWPSQQRVTLQVQSQPQERTARTPQPSPLKSHASSPATLKRLLRFLRRQGCRRSRQGVLAHSLLTVTGIRACTRRSAKTAFLAGCTREHWGMGGGLGKVVKRNIPQTQTAA